MLSSTASVLAAPSAPLFSGADPSLLAVASAAERIDNANWLDDFASAPPHVRDALGMRCESNVSEEESSPEESSPPSIVMVRSHIPFFHFNVASTLGIDSDVAPEPLLDSIQDFFGPGKTHHITVAERFLAKEGGRSSEEETQPNNNNKLHEQLVRRGYSRYLPFDRVILQDPLEDLVKSWSDWGSASELVTHETKAEWSSFLTNYYKMPDLIGDWLQQLVGRSNWFHAILKRDGKVVMARSLYFQNGWAWLGIDAPVPGWTPADCCDNDLAVCAKLLMTAHQEAGVRSFVSDVEAPNVDHSGGPDYDKWRMLGFSVPYRRVVYKWEEGKAETPVMKDEAAATKGETAKQEE
jgi:hypothetical protein